MRRFIYALLLLLILGCTDEPEAVRVLQSAGFTKVQTHGYAWFACSEDDAIHTKFTAVNTQGQRVSGVVCCGLVLKNCTIRF